MAISPPHILVTPLNWGLGHAARCIPLIQALTGRGIKVSLASDGDALLLLKKEFPHLPLYQLPGYDINYQGSNMTLSMLRQSAKLLKAFVREHQAVEKIVKDRAVNIIISDNRYGCYSKTTQNIFITHQLHIIAPAPLLQKPVNAANHTLIKPFDKIWVPDFEGTNNLSGKLSHGRKSKKTRFIGPLTRMHQLDREVQYDVVAVLSGPEPQRTDLERKIFEQAVHLPYRFLIVRGQPQRWEYFHLKNNIEVVSFLTKNALNETMASARMILARSGYSTIMDLWQIKKPAILVPTPGQTEQEYLASRFLKQGIFYTQTQADFQLDKAILYADHYPGFSADVIMDKAGALERAIDSILSEIP